MNEYPRPQLKRNSFFCLNGKWTMNGSEITVPYPPQSELSGYKGDISDILEYRRAFVLPEGFLSDNRRGILHFGAVDQVAEVFVNEKKVACHEGGYLPFSADITDVLIDGENTLRVHVIDTLSHDYPYGKQRKDRGGMWYTPVSGIWQSVWMEAVPEEHIESLNILPDLMGITLTVKTSAEKCAVEIPGTGYFDLAPNKPVRIEIPEPHLWTPDDPYLYSMTVTADNDRVESYFALRTIETGNFRNHPCVLLNGKPIFLNGVLDQGYFADGIYLPHSPEAFKTDILNMKALGINLLRKHCKVEPEAFYRICDQMGILVMQDMVNSGGYSFIPDTALPTIGIQWRPDRFRRKKRGKRHAFFTRHALDTQKHLFNHPCVIAYTIFNEGWGQFDADMHYRLLKKADPSRLYDSTSGWFSQRESDFDSRHVYFRNKVLHGKKLPLFLSECGGFARPIAGHMFNENNKYGYGTAETEEALTSKIEQMWNEMVFPSIANGLCGIVYTQVSDIEDEINGFYTYDRRICKVNQERLRALYEKAQRIFSVQ
ncbi:MAG: glycoside hydrolase family 2 [Clostridia bacterium]|nr:glycoside hydrolase family 2 [Clostridia bacterium]